MSGLAPGLDYLFRVRSYEGHILGPETTIQVKTQGKKLLPVKSLQVAVTKEGTTAKLSWAKPEYKTQKVQLIFISVISCTHNMGWYEPELKCPISKCGEAVLMQVIGIISFYYI